MQSRVLVPERMDDPNLDRDEHFRALRGLQRINRLTGNAQLAWRQIQQLAREQGLNHVRVLDVATGAADIPIALHARAQAAGLELEVDACDVSPQALELAQTNCEHAGTTIRLLELDVLSEPIPDGYDMVISSQFLHHLTDDQAQSVLANMASAVHHRVVVVDLVRSTFNWCQVWLATRVLSRSHVVHFDGPQSIRAAFTVAEIAAIANRVDFDAVSIRGHWPCRFTLVGDVRHA